MALEEGLSTEVAQKQTQTRTDLRNARLRFEFFASIVIEKWILRFLVKLFVLEELKEFNANARNEPDEDASKRQLHDSLHHALGVQDDTDLFSDDRTAS